MKLAVKCSSPGNLVDIRCCAFQKIATLKAYGYGSPGMVCAQHVLECVSVCVYVMEDPCYHGGNNRLILTYSYKL